MIDYPSDDVLIARGKFATLNSERKALVKALQRHIQQLANRAHHALRDPDNVVYAQEQITDCDRMVEAAQMCLNRLAQIVPLLKELRPLAWEKQKEDVPF